MRRWWPTRLYALLSKPPKIENPPAPPSGQPAAIAGQWDVHMEFVRGSANAYVVLEQEGGKLVGTHQGEFASGDLERQRGRAIRSVSRVPLPHRGHARGLQFIGEVGRREDVGHGALGEYGEAKWTAERHQYRTGGGRRG